VSQHPIVEQHRFRSAQHLFGGIRDQPRDWIDGTLEQHDELVTLLWTGKADKFAVWETELFNRSVGTVYTIDAPVPGGLAQTPIRVDRETGYFRDPDGTPVSAAYLLTDALDEIDGDVLADDAGVGLRLYGVGGLLRQLSFIDGLYPRDTWSGKHVTYMRHDCGGGTLEVELESDPALFSDPNTVTARIGDRVVARTRVFPTLTKKLRVPLEADGDRCVVRFTVEKTAVPSEDDPRELGIHFNRFEHRP
jgi:hypothetical protein